MRAIVPAPRLGGPGPYGNGARPSRGSLGKLGDTFDATVTTADALETWSSILTNDQDADPAEATRAWFRTTSSVLAVGLTYNMWAGNGATEERFRRLGGISGYESKLFEAEEAFLNGEGDYSEYANGAPRESGMEKGIAVATDTMVK